MPNKHLVTRQMREEHYDFHGYMVKDSEILTWYKETYSKTKKQNKNKKEN